MIFIMRKILAGMTAGCIALSTFTTLAMASTMSTSGKSTTITDSSEALQNAIVNVKLKITIPFC